MLGKEALALFFSSRNTGTIFHLPGIHTLPLMEAFENLNIHAIMGRHESNCAFMAEGWAQVSGRTGTVAVTPGPGLGNVVTPCMEAFGCDVPLVIIHVALDRKEMGIGSLHEVNKPETFFAGITRKTIAADSPETLIPSLDEAYRISRSGRQGPVVVSIPYTLFEKEVPFEPSGDEQRGFPVFDASRLDEALRGTERPVIIGGRALMRDDAGERLAALCAASSIPFLTSTSGKGVIPEEEDFCFGNVIRPGLNRTILQEADVVIALGTRLRYADAKRRGVKIERLVHIDVDGEWLGRNYPTSLGVAADPLQAVGALSGIFRNRRSAWDIAGLRAAKEAEERDLLQSSQGFRIVSLLRRAIPKEAVTVWDLNLPAYWAEYYFPVLGQRTFLTPRGSSSIFYGVPTAIGAKVGRPERPCLCVTGDGGALPGLAELATVVRYAIPVVFLICNNGGYGILENYMRKRYGVEGSMNLVNPDFGRLAGAFGVKAASVATFEELEECLRTRVTWDEPFVIDFSCPPLDPPWTI